MVAYVEEQLLKRLLVRALYLLRMPVRSVGDVQASPFVSRVPCKCGVRNPDNTCVTGQNETMPYEATTQAQKAYLNGLWNTQPYMPVSETDRYTMMREAPTRMGAQQPWGPLLGR